MNWNSLDNAACYVMQGKGFVINDYGHPDYLRYVEGNRRLTLSYEYVDETAQRGKRFLIFRNYAIHVQVPTEPVWDDDGTPLGESETAIVLDRICRTFEEYKKRPCRVIINDQLYERLAAIDRDLNARRHGASRFTR